MWVVHLILALAALYAVIITGMYVARLGFAPLSIAYLPIGHLKPDPGNARLHSRKQAETISGCDPK